MRPREHTRRAAYFIRSLSADAPLTAGELHSESRGTQYRLLHLCDSLQDNLNLFVDDKHTMILVIIT